MDELFLTQIIHQTDRQVALLCDTCARTPFPQALMAKLHLRLQLVSLHGKQFDLHEKEKKGPKKKEAR